MKLIIIRNHLPLYTVHQLREKMRIDKVINKASQQKQSLKNNANIDKYLFIHI